MEWNPWETYKQDQAELPILAPPCPECMHWHPIRIYNEFGEFDGITLCHNGDMSDDFSCYREIPNKKN